MFEFDNENKYKKYKREYYSGFRKRVDNEEFEDGEFGKLGCYKFAIIRWLVFWYLYN